MEKKAELEELEQQRQAKVDLTSSKAAEPVTTDYQQQKESQKEIRKITRRIQQIEDQLTLIEDKEADISQVMASTNDASQLMDLQNQLDQLSQAQEELMEEWEVLSQGLE